ncbi:hypothetical protein ACVWW6_001026 [Bradyrhizobium sp. USDA 3311]
MYGKYGGGDLAASGGAGNEFSGFAFSRARHSAVVPDKRAKSARRSGTHNHREALWREAGNSESSPNPISWLWVPDLRWRLSGTTAVFAARPYVFSPAGENR